MVFLTCKSKHMTSPWCSDVRQDKASGLLGYELLGFVALRVCCLILLMDMTSRELTLWHTPLALRGLPESR